MQLISQSWEFPVLPSDITSVPGEKVTSGPARRPPRLRASLWRWWRQTGRQHTGHFFSWLLLKLPLPSRPIVSRWKSSQQLWLSAGRCFFQGNLFVSFDFNVSVSKTDTRCWNFQVCRAASEAYLHLNHLYPLELFPAVGQRAFWTFFPGLNGK